MRKLASIQIISALDPIPEADLIERATVLGWGIVTKKGELSVGDKCVYFEIDSYLPIDEKFEFLRKSSYRKNPYTKHSEGFRLKTQKLRGCLSQGLIMPIYHFPELLDLEVGSDVTDILNICKWEMPEVHNSSGIIIGNKPYNIPTTDELRVQSNPELHAALLGKPYYISTKMDGTSMTVYANGDDVGVCGRTDNYKFTPDNTYWKAAMSYGLPEKICGLNIALQGELCGHGIQKIDLNLLHQNIIFLIS